MTGSNASKYIEIISYFVKPASDIGVLFYIHDNLKKPSTQHKQNKFIFATSDDSNDEVPVSLADFSK
jgi:hypothetical protein